MVSKLKLFPWEALFWLAALISLALTDPSPHAFSLCPFHALGFSFCPGCGLGRSISMLAHGEFTESFHMHPLGIFAVIVLTSRVFKLLNTFFHSYGKSY